MPGAGAAVTAVEETHGGDRHEGVEVDLGHCEGPGGLRCLAG